MIEAKKIACADLARYGPVAAMLHEATGSWIPVFTVIIVMDFTTAALAFWILKPMRQRYLERQRTLVTAAAPILTTELEASR